MSNSIINENRYGVHAQEGTATVSNCTITGNGMGVNVSDKATLSNCIVAFNGTGIFRYDTGDTVTLSYNDVYG
ncbi:MAG TPA: right-handed parallel beta-helix repeat-containing protein, partial [Armatimonadota bacterium]|nr:right-handed parallel beta-helix repeat-containing protein [Armatimonadota bacterium]